MTTCEIIMVRYGLPELEQECVDSVREHTTDVDYHFTDHDNYEADEGLAKVWNNLIRASDAEYICLLNNDTRVEAAWLSRLLECFEDNPNLGAVGPMTNAATGPQGSPKYRTPQKRVLSAKYPLVGFCLVFPKKLWEEIGGFDEEFELYGEDSDFCMEIQDRSYDTMIRTDVFIFHHGKSSTPIAEARGKDILGLKKKAKARYIEKWHTPERMKKLSAERIAEKVAEGKERRKQRAEARQAAKRNQAVVTSGTRRYGK